MRSDAAETISTLPVLESFLADASVLVLRRLSACAFPRALRHRFREVGEQHREPQPGRNLELESKPACSRGERLEHQDRGERGADLDHEHHRIFRQCDRIQLDERIDNGAPNNRRIEQRTRAFTARETHRGGIGGIDALSLRFNLHRLVLAILLAYRAFLTYYASSLNQVFDDRSQR